MDLAVLIAIPALMAALVGIALTMILARRDARRERQVDSGRIARLERIAADRSLREIGAQTEVVRLYLALDEDTILRLYKQTPGGALLSKDLEEITESNISASLPLGQFSPGIGRKHTSTQRASFESESEPVRAVLAVEKHLQDIRSIRSVDLTSPIEPIDNRPIFALLEDFEASAARIGLDVPDEIKKSLHQTWEYQNQKLSDQRLEDLTDFVEVRADFTINSSDSGDLVLEAKPSSGSESSRLTLVCKREHVLDVGRTILVPGRTTRATCFGRISQWDETQQVLSLLPITIYSS